MPLGSSISDLRGGDNYILANETIVTTVTDLWA